MWSAREDVSAAFLDDRRYTVPDAPVDKCVVFRAACVRPDGTPGRSVSACYFIGYENREGYENIGVVSLVTDPANLFDDETGIYVLGDVFLDQYDEETETRGFWWWPANYHKKGRSWEREAAVWFFGADRGLQLAKQVGLRVKGGASAGMLPKGLNLYARPEYGGDSRFYADLFGSGYAAKRLSLTAGGNDVYLKVRDWLTTRKDFAWLPSKAASLR